MERNINVSSKFVAPDYEIDDPIIFNNVSLLNKETMDRYIELINNEKYVEATNLLNNKIYAGGTYHHVDFFGAWIFNLFENRLHAIEEYLSTVGDAKPDLVSYTNNIPTGKSNGYSWISERSI